MTTICKIFKLVSRDTIVAEVVNETVSYIEVLNPLAVYNDYPDRESTTMNLQVVRWDFSSKSNEPFRIYKTGIISVSDPTDNMESSYLQVIDDYLSTDDFQPKQNQNVNRQTLKEDFDFLTKGKSDDDEIH